MITAAVNTCEVLHQSKKVQIFKVNGYKQETSSEIEEHLTMLRMGGISTLVVQAQRFRGHIKSTAGCCWIKRSSRDVASAWSSALGRLCDENEMRRR